MLNTGIKICELLDQSPGFRDTNPHSGIKMLDLGIAISDSRIKILLTETLFPDNLDFDP